MTYIETPEDVQRQLEDVRRKLREIEETDSWRVHVARLSDDQPYHIMLLARTLFAVLAGVFFVAWLVALLLPFLAPQSIPPIRLFEQAMGFSLPILFGSLIGALVVGWATTTLAAVNVGKEAPLMEEEELVKRRLLDDAARLARQKAVIERIQNTPAPLAGRSRLDSNPSAGGPPSRAMLPSLAIGGKPRDERVATPAFLSGQTPAARTRNHTRTPMGAKTRGGVPLGAMPKAGRSLSNTPGPMPGFEPTPPGPPQAGPETPLDLSYGAPSQGYAGEGQNPHSSWSRATPAGPRSGPGGVGLTPRDPRAMPKGYPMGTPADPKRVAGAYPLATPVDAARRVGAPPAMLNRGASTGLRVAGRPNTGEVASRSQGVAVSTQFPPKRPTTPEVPAVVESQQGFTVTVPRNGAADPTLWGQVDEPWLEDALEKGELLAQTLPVQAEILFSQEDHLPFTLVLKRVTPAMAVRFLSQYVEFLASISTPPRARVMMHSGTLDPSFHRNVKASLDPYFPGLVEVKASGNAVDILFRKPDDGWRDHPRLPFRKER
ncbi:MAG: hypothetical protein JXX28_07440 [Deltaproteobacteria bacterium]|nr:hypothetical protein [Deltaproteobacteria bacterium]